MKFIAMRRLAAAVLGAALLLAPAFPSAQLLEEFLPTSPKAETFMANARPRVLRQLNAQGLRLGDPVFMRVFKQPKQIEVWLQKGGKYELFKTYPICTYSGSIGPKLREGDQQSPEGFYTVSGGQLNPASRYHLSFDIGYPNAVDRENKRTGGDIMVHGKCISEGCFAMGNMQIEEIYLLAYQAFLQGQKDVGIHIFPFRMTRENLEQNRHSGWIAFWENLKEGYDAFEQTRQVPLITADGDRYAVQQGSRQDSVVMVNPQLDVQDSFSRKF